MRKKIYIQVHKGYIVAKDIDSSAIFKMESTGLNHPRTIAGDFKEIEKVIAATLKHFCGVFSYIFKPVILVHLIPKYEGGYTNVELSAFQLAARAAGVSMCLMCDDKFGPLSENQLKETFKYWW